MCLYIDGSSYSILAMLKRGDYKLIPYQERVKNKSLFNFSEEGEE